MIFPYYLVVWIAYNPIFTTPSAVEAAPIMSHGYLTQYSVFMTQYLGHKSRPVEPSRTELVSTYGGSMEAAKTSKLLKRMVYVHIHMYVFTSSLQYV